MYRRGLPILKYMAVNVHLRSLLVLCCIVDNRQLLEQLLPSYKFVNSRVWSATDKKITRSNCLSIDGTAAESFYHFEERCFYFFSHCMKECKSEVRHLSEMQVWDASWYASSYASLDMVKIFQPAVVLASQTSGPIKNPMGRRR